MRRPGKGPVWQTGRETISQRRKHPEKSAGLFQIDGKLYHLIRIPYTGASESYGYGWDWD